MLKAAGTPTHLVEVCVDSWKYQPLKMRMFSATGEEDTGRYGHHVFRATLKNDDSYIVDLSGAQYGHYDPIVIDRTYFQTRATTMLSCAPIGNRRHVVDKAYEPGTLMHINRQCNDHCHR